VDQYYTGSNGFGQHLSVRQIITSTVQELLKDSKRRFVYVEMAFFWRWWNEQNEETKNLTRKLVDERRLEFVIGGWSVMDLKKPLSNYFLPLIVTLSLIYRCMNDEATTYYTDIIDQQTLGLKFILEEFGPCARPRSAWQIDPFGHSREQGFY
jgi:lysosomal alpha-mannosidase